LVEQGSDISESRVAFNCGEQMMPGKVLMAHRTLTDLFSLGLSTSGGLFMYRLSIRDGGDLYLTGVSCTRRAGLAVSWFFTLVKYGRVLLETCR
jgi:hypothetical protein